MKTDSIVLLFKNCSIYVYIIEISSSIFLPIMADVEPIKQEEEQPQQQQQQLPPPSSSSKQNEELEPEQKRKVFIGSLSYNIDENAFRDYWTKFGSVM